MTPGPHTRGAAMTGAGKMVAVPSQRVAKGRAHGLVRRVRSLLAVSPLLALVVAGWVGDAVAFAPHVPTALPTASIALSASGDQAGGGPRPTDRTLSGTWTMTYDRGGKCDVWLMERNASGVGRMNTTRCDGLPLVTYWQRRGDKITLFKSQSGRDRVGALSIDDCNRMDGRVRDEGPVTLVRRGQYTRCP